MTAFEEILAARAAEAGIPLTAEQIGQFSVYHEMLLDWNTRMNLTALTALEDVAVKHIIDSLTAYDAALFDGARTLIDVGTGAGLPGIPLAVYAPHLTVTLLDALNKRVRFLTEVTAAMGLQNVRCIHARAEEAARTVEHRAAYDIAVSRAVARLPVLLEYTLPFVRVGGTLLALKGRAYAEEQKEARRAAEVLGGGRISARPVHLPGLDDVRAILMVTKERQTPAAYPRGGGAPTRRPIL
ncbi:16S rRNA (guanine(527)-N(7))-methyltransferase RsmG [uncultured Selenomonas sp.]|uniref:16S rRNA (guanine(527)-N(7))-methyltransferase RsmG n=1 Tax=uncultured Selenomonas sp. TaxID=159275 RepID=UPI0028E4FB72|nr:16S rRNA (guanine(527)-N(7))-methyltransferase RsmG [uncultured Selenomonas sp.]